MTRLLEQHPAIEVSLDERGRPAAFRWEGRTESIEVCNHWRIEQAWWRRPIVRDYYKLAGAHLLALVYRDGLDGSWHLERLYD